MKCNWDKYIKNNSKAHKYRSDCQLVTAVNAYYHLTGKIIKQNSKKYKKLVELCLCCYGNCIDIQKAWKELGITENERFDWLHLNLHLKEQCFIELSVWHKRYGFHSVAIVDYESKTKAVRLTNFKWETSIDGWAFLENIKPHIVDNPDRDEPRWNGRTFKLLSTESI